MRLWLLLACLLCGGCIRGGAAQSLFTIGSAALATENLQPQACLFVVGTISGWRGMQLVISHGGISVEDCMRYGHLYGMPDTVPSPLPHPLNDPFSYRSSSQCASRWE